MRSIFKTLKIYRYRSDVGTFVIFPEKPGRWLLTFGTELIGHYDFPEKAAEAVSWHSTGLSRWDTHNQCIPTHLRWWESQRLAVATPAFSDPTPGLSA